MREIQFRTSYVYRAISEIGRGGSGIVYKVVDAELNEFALKLLSPETITTEKVKRFKNEIYGCSKFSHRNIITVVDNGFFSKNERECPFYVMPFYEMTLRDLIRQGMPVNKILRYFLQILDGMEAVHEKGIWHRDLKPENILFDKKEDRIVIADFGIAHFNTEMLLTVIETKPSSKMANFQYAAPEQRNKDGKVDNRADIFSLGLILNEMFTREVLQSVGHKTIQDVAPGWEALDDIVNSMVHQSPDARPPFVSEIKSRLERISKTTMGPESAVKSDIVNDFLNEIRTSTEQERFEEHRRQWFDSGKSIDDVSTSIHNIFSRIEVTYESGKDAFSLKGMHFVRDPLACGIDNDEIGCWVRVPNLYKGNALSKIKPALFLNIELYKKELYGSMGYTKAPIIEIFLFPDIGSDHRLVWKDRDSVSVVSEQEIAQKCFELFITQVRDHLPTLKELEDRRKDDEEYWADLTKKIIN